MDAQNVAITFLKHDTAQLLARLVAVREVPTDELDQRQLMEVLERKT